MRRRGCGINVIIEGLVVNRQGIITESPAEQVQKDIKAFLKDRKVSGTDKSKFYTLLTELYNLCNNAGPYKLVQGDVDVVKGGVDDYETPESPKIDPSIYEYTYTIKFLAAVDVKELYKSIHESFKSMKSKYDSLDIDPYAIVACISSKDEGLYLAVSKEVKALKVTVGYSSFVIEGHTGAFGTEIGLPIDQENCESTDVGGVSTPTGGFSSDSEEEDKKKKRKVIKSLEVNEASNTKEEEAKEVSKEDTPEQEKRQLKKEAEDSKDKEEHELADIERFTCPECGSPNVNSDGEVVVCSDCTYSWEVSGKHDNEVDSMLPQEDDINASDYEEDEDNRENENNDVECLETQQNVDRRDGIS